MAISSDFPRVFEIGPVFRAENSNTRRHLCEFTGLDLEMEIKDHYDETLEVLHGLFKYIFNGLETRFAKEVAIIRTQYDSEPVEFTDEPCILHWEEAMEILTEKGFDMGDQLGDLNGAMVSTHHPGHNILFIFASTIRLFSHNMLHMLYTFLHTLSRNLLLELQSKKNTKQISSCKFPILLYTSCFFISLLFMLKRKKHYIIIHHTYRLDKYPAVIRPFYTMPNPEDKRYSNSYDMFIRGQEICSGAQRCHDVEMLKEILKEKGIDAGGPLEKYMESFTHGVCPHAGAGIGLERVVFLYLGLDNVRKASMFPRDPNRCIP